MLFQVTYWAFSLKQLTIESDWGNVIYEMGNRGISYMNIISIVAQPDTSP